MSSPDRDLLQDARVLGRRLEPDLEAAMDRVSARVRAPRPHHRGRRRALLAVATGAAALLAIAIPGQALLPGRAVASQNGVAAASSSGPYEISAVAVQPVEPAVSLSRAQVLSSRAGTGVTSASPGAGVAACSPAALTLEIAFDRAQFDPGRPVAISQVLRNTSSATCGVLLDACRASITVDGPDGAPVYASGADAGWMCATAPSTVALAAGGIARLTFTWPPASCPGPVPGCDHAPLPVGRYTVDAVWGGAPDSTVTALPRHLDIGDARQA